MRVGLPPGYSERAQYAARNIVTVTAPIGRTGAGSYLQFVVMVHDATSVWGVALNTRWADSLGAAHTHRIPRSPHVTGDREWLDHPVVIWHGAASPSKGFSSGLTAVVTVVWRVWRGDGTHGAGGLLDPGGPESHSLSRHPKTQTW